MNSYHTKLLVHFKKYRVLLGGEEGRGEPAMDECLLMNDLDESFDG